MTPEQQLTLPDGSTVTVRLRDRESYTPNPDNTNKGRERGKAALDKSMQQSGFHRGIVVAGDGTVVNGNHAYQSASELEVVKAWVEVEVSGDIGVVTRRVDWGDAQDPNAILASLSDNRVSQLNFELDPELFSVSMQALEDAEFEMPRELYTPSEIEFEINNQDTDIEPEQIEKEDDRQSITIVLNSSDYSRWQSLKETLGYSSDTETFLHLFNLQ